MKARISLFFLFLTVVWIPCVQAYPWMFFREDTSSIVQLDSHASYFFNGKIAVFSGFQLNYHNSKIDLNLGYNYSFLEESHYFNVSELSVIFPFIFEDWKMTLGIRDVLWSEADRYWNYGLWQARYLLDPLRPKQMGLPGLYFDYKTDTTSFLLSLSYFHIPDVIILPKLKNNKVISDNPFFISGFGNKVHWEVKKLTPFEIDRFFKPAIAFRFKHFIESSSVNLSYAYKPMNQFQKAVIRKSSNLSESPAKSRDVITDFKYSIVSHHLASLEAETKLSQHISLFASVFWDQPKQEKLGGRWITADFSSHLTYSIIAYFQEKWEEDQKTLFTLGWTKTVDSQSDLDSNPFLSEYREVFNRNFDWKNAVSASIEHENTKLFQGFLVRFRTNYALDNKYYHFVLENYFYFTSYIRLYLSGDLFFRLSDPETIPNDSSSIKQYDKLDRLLLGVQYVF